MIAKEIHYLSKVIGVPCDHLRHFQFNRKLPQSVIGAADTIASFSVPENQTWLVTFIYLESYPPVADITLQSDFRSPDLDVSGLGKAWIEINDSPLISVDNPAFGLFNKPVLFAFAGGTTVKIRINRPVGSVPSTMKISLTVHGYISKPRAADCAAQNITNVHSDYTV